ncbi:hypothetical protein [Flindersiella endophytica]
MSADPQDFSDVRLGVVRGISYGLFGRPDEFVPQARSLGAGLIRAYVFWSQVEPSPGRYDWEAVDALLAQLEGAEDVELWVTVCSSSRWATRQPTDFLPPSPAKDQRAYGEFVERLVRHCGGRVRYWQCDNEPSNDLLFAGTAEEYLSQLRTFHGAVKAAASSLSSEALVVLGGCGYDVLSSAAGSPERRFFEHLTDMGRAAFDVFSVHLYGDPVRVPEFVETARKLMRAHGYLKPIVAGEHGGPVPFEFPEAEAAMRAVMMEAFAAPPPVAQSTDSLAEQAKQETPERRALRALYDRMDSLPPKVRMFMTGCPPELEAARHRINCRQLVARTLLALSSGVRRLAYWNLANEVPGPVDHLMMMHLMFGKLPLLAYDGKELSVRHPAADTFALLAGLLEGVRRVTPVAAGGTIYAFQVERSGRPPLFVAWDHRDALEGEHQPAVRIALPWPAPQWGGGRGQGGAVDAFGDPHPVEVGDGRITFDVTDTPVFVEPGTVAGQPLVGSRAG